MLSSSLRADTEDEERQYLKANGVPAEALPQPIRLSVIDRSPVDNTALRFTHNYRHCHKHQALLSLTARGGEGG